MLTPFFIFYSLRLTAYTNGDLTLATAALYRAYV